MLTEIICTRCGQRLGITQATPAQWRASPKAQIPCRFCGDINIVARPAR